MKSIRWKLVFMYLSLVFMVLILTGTYIVISTENREKNKAKEELRQCAVYINEQVVEQYDSRYFQNSLVNLSIVSSSLKNVTGHILDNKGDTIASSTARDENSFQKYNDSAIILSLIHIFIYNLGSYVFCPYELFCKTFRRFADSTKELFP